MPKPPCCLHCRRPVPAADAMISGCTDVLCPTCAHLGGRRLLRFGKRLFEAFGDGQGNVVAYFPVDGRKLHRDPEPPIPDMVIDCRQCQRSVTVPRKGLGERLILLTGPRFTVVCGGCAKPIGDGNATFVAGMIFHRVGDVFARCEEPAARSFQRKLDRNYYLVDRPLERRSGAQAADGAGDTRRKKSCN